MRSTLVALGESVSTTASAQRTRLKTRGGSGYTTNRIFLGLAAAGALLIAGSANAAPVARSASLTLAIDIAGLGGIVVTGTGTIVVDKPAGTLFVPAVLALPATVNLPITTTTAVVSVIGRAGLDQLSATFAIGQVTSTMPGEICGGGGTVIGPWGSAVEACIAGGGLNGGMALSGTVSVNFGGGVTIPINMGAALVGQGGSGSEPPVTGPFFENGKWTTGTAIINQSFTTTVTTSTVFVVGTAFSMMATGIPVTRMTTFQGTGDPTELTTPSGTITLVTPTYVLALGNKAPVFAALSIQPIPEPATLVLIGSGFVGLLFYGRRHLKK